ncbi:MAG: histidine kinase [Hyphomicrobium sp.]|uniref:ATP-binding protein n=1 Tax=Hyphomicrobium sp. TaxID=82 RepID=UPI0039E62A78
MRLLTLLLIRLMAVVLLCLAAAIGCLVWDAHRSIESDVTSTASRVNARLQALYWQQLLWRNGTQRGTLMPLPDWDTVETQSIISPGVCVTFGLPGADRRKLCSQVEALGPRAPLWFATAYLALLGAYQPVQQPLSIHDQSAGLLVTNADPEAALRRAWREISTVVDVAIMLAAGIAVLAALMIGHAIMPARAIINALKKLEEGQLGLQLGKFKSTEFNHIANAVNRLAATLRQTNCERAALTARLFQVQEEERRSIARDLHDEFGQALTATTALATIIESSALPHRPDIAQDARAIAKMQERMMGALRTTLVRLRSQSIEELGLEASLRQLITDFNAQSKTGTVFRLQMPGRLAELQKRVAVDLYRIVQECLTNASKHGRPTEVSVRLEQRTTREPHIALTIEDDGGGDVSCVHTSFGHGILGMRERLAGLGGSLSIANAPRGVRIFATVPLGHDVVYA